MKRAAALGAAILVLAACAKTGRSSNAHAPAASLAENGAQASDGARVYQTNCSSCHQPNGQGNRGLFPPLAGNPAVADDPATVIADVKFGLSGRIVVAGQAYDGMMPNWGQQISDAEIASVVTYIRSAWGNKASAVSAAEVKAVSR